MALSILHKIAISISLNIICILFENDEGIHQLDFSDPVLDLASVRNLDNGRDVGTIKYKLRSLEQSSWPCSSKSHVKAKLVDLAELQSKEGFRKHYITSEITSKIVRVWNETQIDLLKQGLSSKET